MSQLRPWQLIMLAAITLIVCYAIIQGIQYKSFWGITAAAGSSIALVICFAIMVKMNELQEQEEDY